MSSPAKQLVDRIVDRVPLYLLLPPGSLRGYTGVRYLARNAGFAKVSQFSHRTGSAVAHYPSAAVTAAAAALRQGDDELLAKILRVAADRYPDLGGMLQVEAEWRGFRGDHDAALSLARRARLTMPSLARAAALEVQCSYLLSLPTADDVALASLRRFRGSPNVLWSVARGCTSREQFDRLETAYIEQVPDRSLRWLGFRPLLTAAARAGCIETAIERATRGIESILDGQWVPTPATLGVLAGRDAWRALLDLDDLLTKAGVPYFFAAGTALGLVREGGPLAADGDIDVGVFAEDYDRTHLIEVFRSDSRFDLTVPHPGMERLRVPHVKFTHRGGSPIDVFPFSRVEGQMSHDSVFTRWFNSPFSIEHIEVRGHRLPVPSCVDRYLAENYGDWRTPDASFDAFTEDAPNVVVTWSEYQVLHRLRSAYRSLTHGHADRAAVDVQRAGFPTLAERITHGAR